MERYKKIWEDNGLVADIIAAITGAVADLEAGRRGGGEYRRYQGQGGVDVGGY